MTKRISKQRLESVLKKATQFAEINTGDYIQHYWKGFVEGLKSTKIKSKKYCAQVEEFASIPSRDFTEAHFLGLANAIRWRKGIEQIDANKRLSNQSCI